MIEAHTAAPHGWAVIHERGLRRSRCPVACFAHTEVSTVQFGTVQLFNGLGNGGRIAELHKSESAWAIRGAINGEENLGDLTNLPEQSFELCL